MPAFSYLSTYPPTRCGLATFTAALATAAAKLPAPALIVRMMDELARSSDAPLASRSRVVAELSSTGDADDDAITAAAESLSRGEVAVVQHEYGIFGGPDGVDVIRVLERITVPTIVVLHTVLDAPSPGQRDVLDGLGRLAGAVVVMTESARERLAAHYRVDPAIVSVIPHGVANWAAAAPRVTSRRRTIVTWGLLGPGKGIEHGIRAMVLLRRAFPDLRYVVAGQTHPKVLAYSGERYRNGLLELVRELGLEDVVSIDGDYLDAAQLAERVGAAAAVLLPYDSISQVTSGVLVEAIAAGRPVVATPFPHAVELLGDRTGVLVAHGDPAAMAAGIETVLRWGGSTAPHPPAAAETGWAEIARRYQELGASLVAQSLAISA